MRKTQTLGGWWRACRASLSGPGNRCEASSQPTFRTHSHSNLPKEAKDGTTRQVVAGLRPGGMYVLEAYTPAQLAFGTGGPDNPELLMTLAGLREELNGLDFLIGHEIERPVVEGAFHTGRAAVVQVLAQHP